MIAFHGDPKVKAKYLSRLKAHAKADEIQHGYYWENGKGCAVGCTIHSNSHKAYEKELGLPEWLARLEDRLFEGMGNGEAKKFPIQFLSSIPVGMENFDLVKWKFSAFLMKENIKRVEGLKITKDLKEQVVSAIQGVLTVHENAIDSGVWNGSAADSAADSADSAADSAYSAARLAYSAARLAADSAYSAADSAAYKRYAKKLIQLLKAAK